MGVRVNLVAVGDDFRVPLRLYPRRAPSAAVEQGIGRRVPASCCFRVGGSLGGRMLLACARGGLRELP